MQPYLNCLSHIKDKEKHNSKFTMPDIFIYMVGPLFYQEKEKDSPQISGQINKLSTGNPCKKTWRVLCETEAKSNNHFNNNFFF